MGTKKLRTVLAGIISVALIGLGSSFAVAQVAVRSGLMGAMTDSTTFMAIEKGYFREEGIKVEVSNFAAAAQMMAPISAGQLDVASGGISIAFFNAFARGFPVKIVSSGVYLIPGNDADIFMLRADLKEKIKKLSDLKGRKFALNAPGSSLVYVLGKALETEGMTIKDLDMVYISFPDMVTAFQTKAIEAGIQIEPLVTMSEEKGLAVSWKQSSDFVKNPYMQIAVLFYNKDWAEKNRDLANRYMVAYLKGVREYYQAMVNGPNREEVMNMLVRFTQLKNKAMYNKIIWNFIDPNGYVIKESIEDQQKWYLKNGFITAKSPIDQMVDDTYVSYALGRIGVLPCEKCVKASR